ncbi:hypothetical protein GGX14DRAFT_622495 [Mycena pura]|uniref:Uncharacterized protein n=1 Tax=Mycena pura TaxID=153505 RepID=A0AAD6VGC9_9AGAR|nr:hypothetical protein GGX14DRAFT_622495 [Mycena pura]
MPSYGTKTLKQGTELLDDCNAESAMDRPSDREAAAQVVVRRNGTTMAGSGVNTIDNPQKKPRKGGRQSRQSWIRATPAMRNVKACTHIAAASCARDTAQIFFAERSDVISQRPRPSSASDRGTRRRLSANLVVDIFFWNKCGKLKRAPGNDGHEGDKETEMQRVQLSAGAITSDSWHSTWPGIVRVWGIFCRRQDAWQKRKDAGGLEQETDVKRTRVL